jgi:hypothetical protein
MKRAKRRGRGRGQMDDDDDERYGKERRGGTQRMAEATEG